LRFVLIILSAVFLVASAAAPHDAGDHAGPMAAMTGTHECPACVDGSDGTAQADMLPSCAKHGGCAVSVLTDSRPLIVAPADVTSAGFVDPPTSARATPLTLDLPPPRA
jgi:D-arabinose 1-dehydrogenase-like Zn-dependent alcohol dehydrogenase